MQNRTNKQAERLNPCLKEQNQSYQCLSKNNYDHDKCEAYFENYNTCKKFWAKIYSDRKARGITPFLPEPEEREKIKADLHKTLSAK